MADHLKISVSVTPIEELTEENLGTRNIVASEVGTSIGGSGVSIDLANYQGSAVSQGYLNATVNYLDAIPTGEGAQLSTIEPCDAVVIKNTGFRYSSSTVLGASTTDYVMVVYKTLAWSTEAVSGWVSSSGDTAEPHYFMIAWLAPGQAIVLPGGITTANDKFDLSEGSNSELSYINTDANDQGDSLIFCKTFESDGTQSTDGNAVEFLCVT